VKAFEERYGVTAAAPVAAPAKPPTAAPRSA
jgi:ribosomal protein L7/L12